jgi:hypothetical protein
MGIELMERMVNQFSMECWQHQVRMILDERYIFLHYEYEKLQIEGEQ